MNEAQRGTSDRVHFIDWLRCGADLAVVIFHALLPFGSIQPWVIQHDRHRATSTRAVSRRIRRSNI